MIKGRSGEASVCDDFVLNAYQEYSVDTVADLLLPTGFLIDRTTQYLGSLEQLVFLKGNTSEVYSKSEIDFIDGVVDFCIFRDFYKKTRKGMIPCRIASAKIDNNMDIVSSGIAFTKILNKAIDGLNIGFVISEEGILFTGRLFEQGNNIGCYVSDLIKTEEQYDEIVAELIFGDLYDSFIDYYSYLKSVIHYTDELIPYGETLRGAHRIPYTYIEELQDLEEHMGISFAREIERCLLDNEEPEELPYCEKVKECEEYLFKIESSRVNTMEILFEAEEMERLASETEQKNDEMIQGNGDIEGTEDFFDERMRGLLSNPEELIKTLKNKKSEENTDDANKINIEYSTFEKSDDSGNEIILNDEIYDKDPSDDSEEDYFLEEEILRAKGFFPQLLRFADTNTRYEVLSGCGLLYEDFLGYFVECDMAKKWMDSNKKDIVLLKEVMEKIEKYPSMIKRGITEWTDGIITVRSKYNSGGDIN